MFCENCGKQIPDASRFCEYCGAPVSPRTVSADQPQYRQPQYQQPQYQAPRQTPAPAEPKAKGNGALIAVIVAAAIVLACLVGFLVYNSGLTTFGAEAEFNDWNWCELTYYDQDIGIIRSADTAKPRRMDDLWEEVMDMKLRPSREDLEDTIREGSYADMYFADESGEVWLWVMVNEAGQVHIDQCGDGSSYTGGKELYGLLNERLFFAESASLADAVEADGWEGIGIYLYLDGECTDMAVGLYPETVNTVVSQVRKLEALYGGGLCYAPTGYEAMLQLWNADEEYYYIMVYDDGNADIPFGDWTYGFYNCFDLYELLVSSIETVNQMG